MIYPSSSPGQGFQPAKGGAELFCELDANGEAARLVPCSSNITYLVVMA